MLLETHEALAAGSVASFELHIAVGADASLERIVIVETEADAVLVSLTTVSLGAGAPRGSRRQSSWTARAGSARRRASIIRGRVLPLGWTASTCSPASATRNITTVVTHAGMRMGPPTN